MLFGFIVNLAQYTVELFDVYNGEESAISFLLDDKEESSESNEKEGSEKEDFKEKDKISQPQEDKMNALSVHVINHYPDFCFNTISVFLEENTPPPEYS